MKRTIFVSTLVLALMVVLCGEAFSRSTPWGYVDPGTGDDHTWGGDFQVGGDDPGGVLESTNSNWIPTDMFVTNLFIKWLGARWYKSDFEAERFIRNRNEETEPVEPVEPVTSGTGGLQ